jgi:hypothetical protein
MRVVGLDIHRVFAEAVMLENGKTRRLGRVGMTRDQLAAFAQTLTSDDHVVVEATGNSSGASVRRRAPAAWAHCQAGTNARRTMLVEAAWQAVRGPGPLRAFFQRV